MKERWCWVEGKFGGSWQRLPHEDKKERKKITIDDILQAKRAEKTEQKTRQIER